MLKIPEHNRILLAVELTPIPTARFQPTGFPDIGAATYQTPDGTPMLLVESAQSMANRLEHVCFDGELNPALNGLPYIEVETKKGVTTSLQEAHRLNSIYIVKTKDFFPAFAKALGFKPKGKKYESEKPLPTRPDLAREVFKRDPNSIIHGVFLEKIAGPLRLPRMLSAFIEAEGVRTAASGGVKNDRLDASGKESGGSGEGFGNVPYHRTEYTADKIVAHISIDLALLRSYRLPQEAQNLLYTFALWKVRTLLAGDLRLRTACDFEVSDHNITVRRPEGWTLPARAKLDDEIAAAITSAKTAGLLDPVVREKSEV